MSAKPLTQEEEQAWRVRQYILQDPLEHGPNPAVQILVDEARIWDTLDAERAAHTETLAREAMLREAAQKSLDAGGAERANALNRGDIKSEEFVRGLRNAEQSLRDALAATPTASLTERDRRVAEQVREACRSAIDIGIADAASDSDAAVIVRERRRILTALRALDVERVLKGEQT